MNRILVILSGVALAGVIGLSSCEKEDPNPDYPFTIYVKTYNDSISVNNCLVRIFAPGSSVVFTGYTDEYGKVSFEYDKEAVFLVRATRGGDPPQYIGCNKVRLQANEEVIQYVYLEPYDPELEGC